MKTFFKAIVLVPIAVVGIAFAIANRQAVTLSFDPFSATDPAFTLVAPLFLVVFILLMSGVAIGGVASWLGQGRHRGAARRAQAEADAAKAEIERLRTEFAIEARRARARTALPAPALHDAD